MARILSGGGKFSGGKVVPGGGNWRQTINRFTGNRVGRDGASPSGVRRVFARNPADARMDANVSLMLMSSNKKAALTTALTGTNNDLVFTALKNGDQGNKTQVEYINGGASQALSVRVRLAAAGTNGDPDTLVISVRLATDASSVITSTAAQVATAVNADALANDYVVATNAPGNDGTGLVTAMAATPLTGGVFTEQLNTSGQPSNPNVVKAPTTAVRGAGKSTQTATPAGVTKVRNRSTNRSLRKR
jgi:hypothetical protein